MVVLEVRLFIGLEITGTDEDARVAEGLFGGHTNEEDFFFFLLVVVVVLVRGKRTILSIFFFRMGLGGGATVKGIVEVGFVVVLVLVLRAIFSAMCTCRTASLMML